VNEDSGDECCRIEVIRVGTGVDAGFVLKFMKFSSLLLILAI
jgi:hypothetical protein